MERVPLPICAVREDCGAKANDDPYAPDDGPWPKRLVANPAFPLVDVGRTACEAAGDEEKSDNSDLDSRSVRDGPASMHRNAHLCSAPAQGED